MRHSTSTLCVLLGIGLAGCEAFEPTISLGRDPLDAAPRPVFPDARTLAEAGAEPDASPQPDAADAGSPSDASPSLDASPLPDAADAGEGVVDRFQQLPAPTVDLLLVVAPGARSAARQGFDLFLAHAVLEGIDWRAAVIGTDFAGGGGRFRGQPTVITPASPSPAAALAGALDELGASSDDAALTSLLAAITEPLASGYNRGFLREAGAFAAIVLSPDDDDGRRPAADAAAMVLAARAGTGLDVTANAVDGESCPGLAPGPRLADFAARLGGARAPLCGDLAPAFTELGPAGFGFRRRFKLSAAPEPSSLSVTVNGAELSPPAYALDLAERTIAFAPSALPEAGAEIVATYRSP